MARPRTCVPYANADHFDGIGPRDQDEEVLFQAVADAREEAITVAMANDRCRVASAWGGRRRPELPGVLVAEVNGLARRVGHGIVAPGREAIHLAIASPGVTAA